MKKFEVLIAICLSFVLTNELKAQGVEISSGGKIECVSSVSIEIKNGNFINNGTYTMGAETFTFSGTTNGNISGSSNNDIYSLNVNNSNGVSLNGIGYCAVNKILTFSTGLLNTGSNFIIINDNATVSGASTSKYINGNCRKVGNDAFTFPIGNNSKYAPIGISAPANVTDHYTAAYYKTNPNSLYSVTSLDLGLNNVSTKEYWTLNRTNGTSNVFVTLNWDNTSGVSQVADLQVARWDGVKWTDAGNTSTTGNSSLGSITSSIVSSFSPFTLGSSTVNNPLPVDLLYFNADCNNSKVKINWSTASEVDCDYFIVEKMYEGESFAKIAKINGSGNSNQIINYEIEDDNSKNIIAYYRLTQVDYSGIEEVMNDKITSSNCNFIQNNINVYNDYNGLNIIVNTSKEETVLMKIFDLTGKLILSNNLVLNERENLINMVDYNLSKGMYIVNIIALDYNKSTKIMVK